MKQLEIHPLADLFPALEGNELAELVADIRTNGLHSPITLCDGKILDGRNRYRACREAGVSIETKLYSGSDPLGFVLSSNLHRRHLNESQRAMVAAKLADMPQGARTDLKPSANLPKVSQSGAARMLNVSNRSLRTARTVRKRAVSRLSERVEHGEVAVSVAAKIAQLPVEEQHGLATADAATLRDVVKKLERAKREVAPAEKIEQMPRSCGTKLYCLIHVDPLWPADDDGQLRETTFAMKVPAAEDCLLLLWAPVSRLPDALRLMNAWGFTYKSHIVWIKDRAEAGFCIRIKHELLLIGVRGNVGAPLAESEHVSLVGAEAKTAIADMIAAMFPGLSRIDLFAEVGRRGWDVGGHGQVATPTEHEVTAEA